MNFYYDSQIIISTRRYYVSFISLFLESSNTPLQYSCLENPMVGGAWSAAAHGVAKSRTQLSSFTTLLIPLFGLRDTFSSVQFSCSVLCDSLQPHELQHARPPCASLTPGVHSNSHPYMTTGKTIDLTRRTFVGKVMSLLFNMLSRLVITFLPREGKGKSLSRVQLFVTPWTVAYQAYPTMGFSRQEYWSGLPFPSPMHESEKSK